MVGQKGESEPQWEDKGISTGKRWYGKIDLG
jgi:hypothetical protein